MNDLKNPIKNAQDVARELETSYGFATEVVSNPDLQTIERKLFEYRRNFQEGRYSQSGQLYIFFTGHGLQKGRNGYFIPSDGDPEIIHRTGVEYDWLRSELDDFACQHIMVTIDACHSITFDPNWQAKTGRSFGRKGDATRDKTFMDHEQYKARLFITSDAKGNETPDRSSLARELLTALRNHRSPNGYLTHHELFGTYLKQNAFPTPGGGEFGSDEVGSRFLFFRQGDGSAPSANISQDLAAWQEAERLHSCDAYQVYLDRFPNGDFANLARQKLEPCQARDRMNSAWEAAKRQNNCSSYAAFVRDYPDSPYASAAAANQATLNCAGIQTNSAVEGKQPLTRNSGKVSENELAENINRLLKKGYSEELLVELKKATIAYPNNASYWAALGQTYEEKMMELQLAYDHPEVLEIFENAELAYTRAKDLKPNNFSELYRLALLYYNRGANMTQELVKLSDDFSREGQRKYDKLKKDIDVYFVKSLPLFKQLESINPNDKGVLQALRELYARKNDFELSNEFKQRLNRLQRGEALSSYFKR